MYIRIFIEIYNWHNLRLVNEIHKIAELEKYPISKVENPLNLSTHQFYKIHSIL